ncbi:MAG: hypothetical protein JSS75_08360 [Bacteroidetes bacterium]|nr:hypothetical protein [Bacteroidota bacterium]
MQFLIETDILRDYLTHRSESPSVLRRALQAGSCYTTMYNALELFAQAASAPERAAIKSMLMAVRVLGFNARTAEPFAELRSMHPDISEREMMVLGMARASKLVVLTRTLHDRYAALGAVPVVSMPEEVPGNAQ